jgi:virginiamycin B lyase
MKSGKAITRRRSAREFNVGSVRLTREGDASVVQAMPDLALRKNIFWRWAKAMKRSPRPSGLAWAALIGCAQVSAAAAVTITGQVASGTKPVPGAMITIFDETKSRRDTAYADAAGHYSLATDISGKASVRARAPYFKDATKDIDLPSGGAGVVDYDMARETDPAALSDSLTASAHLTALSWANPDSRAAFVSQCNYCHQVGNALTRVPRSRQDWDQTVRRMEGYFAILTNREAEEIAATLARSFDGKPIAAAQVRPWSDELAKARVKEWVVGDEMTFVHDTDVGADDRLYGSDEGHDIVWVLDRKTGKIEANKEPDIDLPEGGIFSGFQLPIGVFTGKHGPHSMAQAKDGKFWITNALSSTLASFDPATRAFKLYDIGGAHLYPHTVRIDGEGIVWFTIAASNEVARFDPATEKLTVIPLPHDGFWRGVTDYAFPYVLKIASFFPKEGVHLAVSHTKWADQGRDAFSLPYGIDVNPVDGSIWYAKLNVDKIGRIDPKTFAIREFDTPMKGPRRPRFDKDGNLWVPAFDDSGLMKFDTRTETFETLKLPLLAPNEYETPYALNIHPKTGDVWITSNMSDRIFRFTPSTKTFVSYPLPTRVTWLRDLVFARDGGICSSSSNMPAYGIEGGKASFICLYPDGETTAD